MGEVINLNASSSFRSPPKYSFTNAPLPTDKKRNIPGPGQYPLSAPDKDKFTRTPSWSIGASCRDSGKFSASLPGPGQYTPANPAFVSPKWAFGSEPRLRTMKPPTAPGPGQYEVRGKNDGLAPSICSKPEGKARSLTPGPGSYKPSWECTSSIGSSPKVSFGASCRKDLVKDKGPGPGSYEHLTSLGGNVAMRTPAKYSIKGRYEPPKPFVTPGPAHPHTTFK